MSPEDVALREHMQTLNDEQLSDLLAQMDAAEMLSRSKTIDMRASAIWYATVLGWPVFPLIPGGKRPLTEHGFKDATTDFEHVTKFWQRWPDANIGTPTGARETGGCGFDVIDIDGTEGLRSLAALKHASCPPDCCARTFCDALGELPPVEALAFTPGDSSKQRNPGRHYYVQPTGDGNGTNIAPGIDYRGAGGYVVAAPSVGPDGRRYSWITLPTIVVAVAA